MRPTTKERGFDPQVENNWEKCAFSDFLKLWWLPVLKQNYSVLFSSISSSNIYFCMLTLKRLYCTGFPGDAWEQMTEFVCSFHWVICSRKGLQLTSIDEWVGGLLWKKTTTHFEEYPVFRLVGAQLWVLFILVGIHLIFSVFSYDWYRYVCVQTMNNFPLQNLIMWTEIRYQGTKFRIDYRKVLFILKY